jgi:hypothetical protein
MKTKTKIAALVLFSASYAAAAVAGPAAQLGSGGGAEGSVEPVAITVDYEAGGDVVGGQFQVGYDNSNLTPDMTGACTSANWTCSILVPGTLQFVSNIVVDGLPTEQIGVVEFDISAAAVGTYPLAVADEQYGDIDENPIPPAGTVDGQIVVLGPEYTSDPVPGAIDLGSVQTGGTNPSQIVTITNTGGDGTGLDVTCVEAPDTTAFIIGNGSVADLAKDASHEVTVSCNAALTPDTYTGTMECSHNGTNISSPAVYDLTCTVTPGPEPAYGSTPAPDSIIDMSAEFVGDVIADESVVIENIGDAGTTLSGECSLTGHAEISLTGGGFDVPEAGPSAVQTLSCDSGAEGDFTAQLSCTHNGVNIPTPATYTVNCSVGPLRPAVFGSIPAPGPIDINDGLDVVVGDTPPEAVLQIANDAAAPAQDLGIECGLSGDPEISVLPDISGGVSVSPGSSTALTFTCATDTADTFTALRDG